MVKSLGNGNYKVTVGRFFLDLDKNATEDYFCSIFIREVNGNKTSVRLITTFLEEEPINGIFYFYDYIYEYNKKYDRDLYS